MSKFIDPNSKAAILYSQNLPLHWIVFDGAEYWMVHGVGQRPWADKKPYLGHTQHLVVSGAYTKLCIPDLPFLPGVGTPDETGMCWGELMRVLTPS